MGRGSGGPVSKRQSSVPGRYRKKSASLEDPINQGEQVDVLRSGVVVGRQRHDSVPPMGHDASIQTAPACVGWPRKSKVQWQRVVESPLGGAQREPVTLRSAGTTANQGKAPQGGSPVTPRGALAIVRQLRPPSMQSVSRLQLNCKSRARCCRQAAVSHLQQRPAAARISAAAKKHRLV